MEDTLAIDKLHGVVIKTRRDCVIELYILAATAGG